MSEITHPVRVRTKIQAVLAPGWGWGALGGPSPGEWKHSRAGWAVERKESQGPGKSGENRKQKTSTWIFKHSLKSTEEGALILEKLREINLTNRQQKSIKVKPHTKLQEKE